MLLDSDMFEIIIDEVVLNHQVENNPNIMVDKNAQAKCWLIHHLKRYEKMSLKM